MSWNGGNGRHQHSAFSPPQNNPGALANYAPALPPSGTYNPAVNSPDRYPAPSAPYNNPAPGPPASASGYGGNGRSQHSAFSPPQNNPGALANYAPAVPPSGAYNPAVNSPDRYRATPAPYNSPTPGPPANTNGYTPVPGAGTMSGNPIVFQGSYFPGSGLHQSLLNTPLSAPPVARTNVQLVALGFGDEVPVPQNQQVQKQPPAAAGGSASGYGYNNQWSGYNSQQQQQQYSQQQKQYLLPPPSWPW
jgi:hypothetical protein